MKKPSVRLSLSPKSGPRRTVRTRPHHKGDPRQAQGAEKLKLRACSAVFWNEINKDLDQTASHCTECQEAQPRQTREELESTDIPPYAWHTVSADLFFLNNADYLIVVDYYYIQNIRSSTSYHPLRALPSVAA